jgi:hypothetical protein
MVLLTTKFLDVAKFNALTPLSLLISCELSFPIVSLKISSLSTFAKAKEKVKCSIQDGSKERKGKREECHNTITVPL